MNDPNSDFPVGEVDAAGQPIDLAQVLAPQQAPMDDAAGGPDADTDDDYEQTIEETSTDDLSVQGGA